jgi:hypothetical protein
MADVTNDTGAPSRKVAYMPASDVGRKMFFHK